VRSPLFALLAVSLSAVCANENLSAQTKIIKASIPDDVTLKESFKGKFLVGAALNQAQFSGQDERGAALVRIQFNSITPENILKWESVHPEPDKYIFGGPDQFVEFGEKNNMVVIGHVLIWHNQTPKWVFANDQLSDGSKPSDSSVDRETLLKRMHDHIQSVVGRYKGRIKGWDVVNEALEEDGSLRQTPWLKIIGEEYMAKAFQFAHEADPDAELYYNDFSLENAPKREGAIRLIKKLQSSGVRIAAVGLQGHYKMDWPRMGQVDSTIEAFGKLGVKVDITELDIDVVPATQGNRGADLSVNKLHELREDIYANGLPDFVQMELAKRYADLFTVFVRHANVIDRVTFWGVTDGDSWLNSQGRVNYPLLFDRKWQPKPAFDAVIKTGL
jgi:endo-1,4-beta-xylanase